MKKHALIFCSLFTTALLVADQAAPKTTMFDEARAGKIDELRKRLNNDEDCSQTEEGTGDTVLHIAAENGHTDMVDLLTTEPEYSFLSYFNPYYLIWSGAKLPDKNKQNKDGNTAVHLSIAAGKSEATEVLFRKGVRTDICNKQEYPPAFMLLNTSNTSMIPLLARYHCLEKKVNGNNLLQASIKQNKPFMTAWLIDQGLLIDEKDGQGKTIAGLAAIHGNIDALIRLQTKNVNLNEPDKHGARPIHYASSYGQYDVLKFLSDNNIAYDVTDNQGNTPSHYAAFGGNKKVIDFFFAHKVNMQQRNNNGEDIFAIACKQKHWSLARDLAQKPGVDINSRDNQGKTALIRAIENNDYEGIQHLCNLGVNTAITDNNQENALHKASRCKDKNIAQLILSQNRALLENKNKNGETPFFIAVNEGYFDVVDALIQAGATVNTTNNDGRIPLFISVSKGYKQTTYALLQARASLMAADKQGNTIIHIAAGQPNTEILTSILQQRSKPNIDTPNQAGLTPLHCAAQSNNVAGIKILEEHGAAFNSITAQGNTIVHSAIEKDAAQALEYSLARSPRLLDVPNKHNEIPFIFSCRMGSLRCAEMTLRESDFTNRNVEFGLHAAKQHNRYNIRDFLQKKIRERKNHCKKIHDEYPASFIRENELLTKEFATKGIWEVYVPSNPNYYTEDQLYYMTEAEREKVHKIYRECENRERQIYDRLSHKLNAILSQEEAERIQAMVAQQKRDRAEQEQRDRAERKRQKREDKVKRELDEKNAAIEAKKHQMNEQAQRESDPIEQQKALDYWNQDKANKDAAAAKHQQALEGQQQHAAMDLKPSAPPMESTSAATECSHCGIKPQAKKHLPCPKCREAVMCVQCLKTYAGRCSHCFELHTLGIEKERGECCFGFAECVDQQDGVTVIPCDNCKKESSSDRMCKKCLDLYVKNNEKKNQANTCPRCPGKPLNPDLVNKIISSKQKIKSKT